MGAILIGLSGLFVPSGFQGEFIQAHAELVGNINESSGRLASGASLYQEHCARCHGPKGDGNGELAADLNPRPTNLSAGIFKFRSTPSGALPTDEDLFRTISRGIPGTAMSDFEDIPKQDRLALVVYVKSLSYRFKEELASASISFPENRPFSIKDVSKGQALFDQMQCQACHGGSGQGDGPLAEDLTDSDGLPIRPANLTKPSLKSGKGPKAIYRTVMTGLDGTPMPSYGDSLSQEEGWDLAVYVFSLGQERGEE